MTEGTAWDEWKNAEGHREAAANERGMQRYGNTFLVRGFPSMCTA